MIIEVVLFILAAFICYKLYTVLGNHDSEPNPVASSASSLPKAPSFVPAFELETPLASEQFLIMPDGFDEMHFMNGALEAYKLLVRALFNRDLVPCRSFLTETLYSHFEKNLHQDRRLVQQKATSFRLTQAQKVEDGLEATVETKGEVVVHHYDTNQVETILVAHKLIFFRSFKTSSAGWQLTALEMGSV